MENPHIIINNETKFTVVLESDVDAPVVSQGNNGVQSISPNNHKLLLNYADIHDSLFPKPVRSVSTPSRSPAPSLQQNSSSGPTIHIIVPPTRNVNSSAYSSTALIPLQQPSRDDDTHVVSIMPVVPTPVSRPEVAAMVQPSTSDVQSDNPSTPVAPHYRPNVQGQSSQASVHSEPNSPIGDMMAMFLHRSRRRSFKRKRGVAAVLSALEINVDSSEDSSSDNSDFVPPSSKRQSTNTTARTSTSENQCNRNVTNKSYRNNNSTSKQKQGQHPITGSSSQPQRGLPGPSTNDPVSPTVIAEVEVDEGYVFVGIVSQKRNRFRMRMNNPANKTSTSEPIQQKPTPTPPREKLTTPDQTSHLSPTPIPHLPHQLPQCEL